MIAGIVAVSSNGMIGLNGLLPWDIPEEFAYFEAKIAGSALVIGRSTYELMLDVERDCFVVTTHPELIVRRGCQAVDSVQNALLTAMATGKNVFVIGGASIYEATWRYCQDFYLTQIEQVVEGDTKFPETILFNEWNLISCVEKTYIERKTGQPVVCRFIHFRQPNPLPVNHPNNSHAA